MTKNIFHDIKIKLYTNRFGDFGVTHKNFVYSSLTRYFVLSSRNPHSEFDLDVTNEHR